MMLNAVGQPHPCTDNIHSPLSPIRVAIVEDWQSIAQMLQLLCEQHWGMEVVSLAHTATDALREIVRTKPDVVLLDLNLPDADGVALAGKINAAVPAARIIVVSGSCCPYQLHRLGEHEVCGFVDKIADGLLDLGRGIEQVHRGGTHFSARYLNATRQLRCSDFAFFKLLSDREQEILHWITRAMTDDEVAAQLNLSAFTVQTHRHHIMQKLNVPSTPKLIRLALDLGFGFAGGGGGGLRN